ncbi:hypothetical protein Pmar_PMAR008772, partial [Perkinsus marinus ATCC 50983]
RLGRVWMGSPSSKTPRPPGPLRSSVAGSGAPEERKQKKLSGRIKKLGGKDRPKQDLDRKKVMTSSAKRCSRYRSWKCRSSGGSDVCQVCLRQKQGKILKCSFCGFRCHQKCSFPKLSSSSQKSSRGWICGGCAQEYYWRCGLPIHYDNCLECGKSSSGAPSGTCRGCRYSAHVACGRLKDGYCWQCRANGKRAVDLFNWSPVFETRDGRTRMLMAGKTVVIDNTGAASGMQLFLSKGEVINWTDGDQVRTSDGALLNLTGDFSFATARRIWSDRAFVDRDVYKPCTWVCCVLTLGKTTCPISLLWQCLARYNNQPFPKRLFSWVAPDVVRAISQVCLGLSPGVKTVNRCHVASSVVSKSGDKFTH